MTDKKTMTAKKEMTESKEDGGKQGDERQEDGGKERGLPTACSRPASETGAKKTRTKVRVIR